MTLDFDCNNKVHLDMCGSTVKLDGTKVTVDGEFVETFEANTKQDKLISGENLATINGKSLLDGGDIVIEGGEGSGTTVIVDGEAVETFDADTKLDKVENPSFADKYVQGAVYGVSNPDAYYPLVVDEKGLVVATYLSTGNTIASRSRQGFIYGNSSQGQGVLLADTEFYNYARDPYWLPNGATSGTIDGSIVSTIISGSNKVIILDGEMYRQVYKDNININAFPTTIIYQHIDDNAIKTITIDITQNPRPWTLTVEENNKLDKDTTTEIPARASGLIYGRDVNGQKMLPYSTNGDTAYLVQRNGSFQILCRGWGVYPYDQYTNVAVTRGTLSTKITSPFKLQSGQTSGNIVNETASYERETDFPSTVALQLMLDGELYHQVSWDETNRIKTFQHIEDNIIKTITLNMSVYPMTWTLTTSNIDIDVDSELSSDSINPVQNNVIYNALSEINTNIEAINMVTILEEGD